MKFYIKQKVFSLRDRFQVLDAEQQPVFQVQGKMFSLSNKLDLQRPDGTPVLQAHRKVFTFLPKYFIESPDGEQLAVVQRRFGLRPKFDVTLGTELLQVSGTLFAHAFQVMDERGVVASIQKKIISWGDTYEIDIQDDRRIELLLFVVIIIDQVLHEQKNRGHSS